LNGRIHVSSAVGEKRGSEIVNLLLSSVSSVVNFSKEVLTFIVVSELLKPQGQDSPVNDEKDGKKANIINTEPFVGTLCCDGCCAGKNSRDGTGKSSNYSIVTGAAASRTPKAGKDQHI